MYDPWRTLWQQPNITVRYDDLGDTLGYCDTHTRTIWLHEAMGTTQRRCTLAHELIHLQRGGLPDDPVAAAEEEQLVDRITARLLIPHLDELADVLSHTGSHREAARVLHVDVATLAARLLHLDPGERAFITATLGRRCSTACDLPDRQTDRACNQAVTLVRPHHCTHHHTTRESA